MMLHSVKDVKIWINNIRSSSERGVKNDREMLCHVKA